MTFFSFGISMVDVPARPTVTTIRFLLDDFGWLAVMVAIPTSQVVSLQ